MGQRLRNPNLTSGDDKEVGLNLNIKDGLPCLHIRYKGFRLRPKDKIYFLDVAFAGVADPAGRIHPF